MTFSWIMIPASKGQVQWGFMNLLTRKQILACADYPYLLRTRLLMSQYWRVRVLITHHHHFLWSQLKSRSYHRCQGPEFWDWVLLTIYIISCLLSISKCSNKGVNCPGPFPPDPHCFTNVPFSRNFWIRGFSNSFT